MKKRVSFLLSLVMVLGMAASAAGGESAGAFAISPFIAGYTFDGTQHFETSPAFGLRLGYDVTRHWGIEGVGHFMQSLSTQSGTSQKILSYRIDILYNFNPEGPTVPYVAVGGGGITYGGKGVKISGENTDAATNIGLGIKHFVTDTIALRGDLRQIFALQGSSRPKYNWEYGVGVTFLFGKVPAVAAPVTTAKGSIGNGAISKEEPNTVVSEAREAERRELAEGGVAPRNSGMATTPSSVTEAPGANGAAGTARSTALVGVKAGAEVSLPAGAKPPLFTLNIEFPNGKATIPESYYPELAKAGNFLKEHPQELVVIEGHTDNIGGAAYNLTLSEWRAQAVKNYLVDYFGIDPSHLAVKGYGSSRPIAENTTSDGRQTNRRVVIRPASQE